jgi:predicted nucleotidyltransferase
MFKKVYFLNIIYKIMYDHHKKAIEKLSAMLQEDDKYLALLIGGSIAKKSEKENSDIDIIIVATDEEFNNREKNKDFHFFDNTICDYPDGYIDGKVINLEFLKRLESGGSEPARSAFNGTIIAFSKIPNLEDLIRRIPVYQENEREEKIKSFYTQVVALRWFIGEAQKRNDRYLLLHAVSDLVLFGGRLILAHNRILYPYHKWFITELRKAPDKPENLMELIDKLLENPNHQNSETFCECILNFTDWVKPEEGWVNKFLQLNEWNWMNKGIPVEDW